MGIYDRYIYRFFFRVLTICFFVGTMVFIIFDCFSHLDEFLAYGERSGSLWQVVSGYYSARIFWFFDCTSSMLALIAAAITVSWMQHSNELVAMMAAGISRGRIIRPLLVCVLSVSLLATCNRELVIPRYRSELSRNVHTWLGDSAGPVQPRYDNETVIFFTGTGTYAAEQRIQSPTLHLTGSLAAFAEKIQAANAFYHKANDQHPAGYLLVDVQAPENLNELPSAQLEGRTIIYTPLDASWLKPGQCFVVSGIEFEQFAGGNSWWRNSSSQQLIAALQNPSLGYGADVRVTIHARMIQPILDMLLFLIGLSVVFTRGQRNVFKGGAYCVGVVGSFYGLVISCQALGSNYLLNPALAVWVPVMILAPVTYLFAATIWE